MDDPKYKDPLSAIQPDYNDKATKIECLHNEVGELESSKLDSCSLPNQEFFVGCKEFSTAKESQRLIASTMSLRCLAVVSMCVVASVAIISASTVGIFVAVSALLVVALVSG